MQDMEKEKNNNDALNNSINMFVNPRNSILKKNSNFNSPANS